MVPHPEKLLDLWVKIRELRQSIIAPEKTHLCVECVYAPVINTCDR